MRGKKVTHSCIQKEKVKMDEVSTDYESYAMLEVKLLKGKTTFSYSPAFLSCYPFAIYIPFLMYYFPFIHSKAIQKVMQNITPFSSPMYSVNVLMVLWGPQGCVMSFLPPMLFLYEYLWICLVQELITLISMSSRFMLSVEV